MEIQEEARHRMRENLSVKGLKLLGFEELPLILEIRLSDSLSVNTFSQLDPSPSTFQNYFRLPEKIEKALIPLYTHLACL
jgi:hypothetical protein